MSEEGEKASWLEPLPEEYTTEEDTTGRRMLIAALTVVVLAVFGGLIWYSYLEGTDIGPVPVVRADKSVVKEKPDTPGGLQVLDQDKGVFNRLVSDRVENSEQLAPSGDLPLDRPVETKAVETATDMVAEDIKSEAKEITAKTVEPIEAEQVASEVATIAPASAGKSPVSSEVSSDVKIGNFLVQLGAFGKKNTAIQLWQKLQRDNGTLLAGLSSDIMMIDLGKKGVLYRLRGGMVADRASADKICAGLKAKKQACIVVAK